MRLDKILKAYDRITASAVFRLDGEEINLPAAVIDLCNAIDAYEGEVEDWCYHGEHAECDIGDFLAGAYWAFAERGSWISTPNDDYKAYSAIGGIYSPSRSANGPEPCTTEATAYELISAYLDAHPSPIT